MFWPFWGRMCTIPIYYHTWIDRNHTVFDHFYMDLHYLTTPYSSVRLHRCQISSVAHSQYRASVHTHTIHTWFCVWRSILIINVRAFSWFQIVPVQCISPHAIQWIIYIVIPHRYTISGYGDVHASFNAWMICALPFNATLPVFSACLISAYTRMVGWYVAGLDHYVGTWYSRLFRTKLFPSETRSSNSSLAQCISFAYTV